MLLETVIAALVPVGIDGIKQFITKITGGVQPQTIEDKIKLQEAENATMESLAKLDNPYGTPSQWVVDLRASSRYIAAIFVIASGILTLYIPVDSEVQMMALEAVSVVFGFLFGHRMSVNFGKK